MVTCRFDNAISGQALTLQDFRARIEARSAHELPAAINAIEEHQRRGRWIALALPYAVGEWLEPTLTHAALRADDAEHAFGLTALVFDACRAEQLGEMTAAAPSCGIVAVRPSLDFDRYRAKIEQIRAWIEAGDVYQINYTFPLEVQIAGDPALLYRQLIQRHPVAHAAYIADQQRHILSFSPELFLSRAGRRLTSRPMKGTAPRHADPLADQQSASALLASVKDRAENIMIVDLLRNDLGRLARPGSVRVENLCELERYPSVWTMTSTISAEIGPVSLLAILKALFPCGSVTGAPKIAAMRYIRELEPDDRGVYCGSVGWLAPNGDFSFNVAIRTLVVDAAGRGKYGVGGGIVFDSDAATEWLECQWKARVMAPTGAANAAAPW